MISKNVDNDNSSFISPFWDFIFVGGLTFFFLPLFVFYDLSPFVIGVIGVTIYALTFVFDNPHFMTSYQLMYEDFFKKIGSGNTIFSRGRYFFSGVIVPVLLLGFYGYSYFYGVENNSSLMLGHAVNVMLFFVGWHYVKQGYGVLMAFSVRQRLFLSEIEKKIILYNSYAVWIAVWLFYNRNPTIDFKQYFFMDISPVYIPFDGSLFVFAALVTTLLVLFLFIRRIYSRTVAWNGWVGYLCAVYLWMIVLHFNSQFLMVVPVMHSLQYLLFSGKISFEKRRNPTDQKVEGFWGFVAISGILGILSLWMVPVLLDMFVPYNHDIFGPIMFMMMFVVFISIHHYFIDFAIWRKDNPEMKYLYN